MPEDLNPFAAPQSEPDPAADNAPNFAATAWRIIVAWEKLRIGYLAWLSCVSLAVFCIMWEELLERLSPGFVATLFAGFIGANLCFTAGHVLELAIALLGVGIAPRRWIRAIVFALGTLFASLLTFVILGFSLSDF